MKLIDLLNLLDALYDREEFYMLCFALDVDHDSFETRGKESQIRELLTWLRRRKLLPELIEIVSQERPQGHSNWESVRQAVLLIQEESQDSIPALEPQSLGSGGEQIQGFLGRQLGNFHLVEKLGQGGMAEVYKGYRADLDQFAAVKIMHSFLATQDAAVSRFRQEAKALASLDHPHIIRLFEFQQYARNAYYLVMEYIQGPTLKAYLEQMMSSGQPLALTEAVALTLQIADALAYAHQQGIIHRDIKPANIMLAEQGRAVLMDFGIVKLLNGLQASVYTATGAMMGTPAYLPPEQALGGQGDARADIYSLGVLLFYMTTGRLPFVAEAPMAVVMKHISEPVPLPESYNPAIPLPLQQVILRALAKDPNGRYPTMVAMIDAIKQVNLQGQVLPNFANFMPELALGSAASWTEEADWREPLAPSPFQVPPPIPYFAGRDQAIEALMMQLTSNDSNSIVGLVGFGGVGKTAVAIQTTRQLRDTFPDGILWAHLDNSTVEAELTSFANAYGQAEALAKLPNLTNKAEFVRDILADKKILVVLDQASDNEQVKWLLPSGPENKALITTRNGKLLTNLNANIVPLRAMTTDEGLSLLREMVGAQRVATDFACARQIVEDTGGLPLAISIAAGFLNEATDLTLDEYAGLLHVEQERLEHLTDWSDTTRDVSASFELSYHSLPAQLQKLFAALAIFDGPDFDSHAVAAILKIPVAQVKLGLGRLFFLSLISSGLGEREQLFPIEADGNGRYRLNPLLKIFARKKLGDTLGDLQEKAARYYINLAITHQLPEGFAQLDLEWQNIYHALRWAYSSQEWSLLTAGVLALTHKHMGSIGFMDVRGHWSAARQFLHWAEDGMEHLSDVLLQARILTNSGGFALRQGELTIAADYLTKSWELLQSLHETTETILLQAHVCNLQFQLVSQSNSDQAQVWLNRLETILTYLPEAEQGPFYISLAAMYGRMGDLNAARKAALSGLNLLPDEPSIPRINGLMNLGIIYRLQGQLAESLDLFNQALALATSLRALRLIVFLRINMANSQLQLNQYQQLITNMEEALPIANFIGAKSLQFRIYDRLGVVYSRLGNYPEAVEILQKALALAQTNEIKDDMLIAYINLCATLLTQPIPDQVVQTYLEQAFILNNSLQQANFWSEMYRVQAQWYLSQKQVEAAEAAVSQSLAFAQTNNDLLQAGISWHVKGQITQAQGQLAAAETAYRQSLAILQTRDPYEQAQTQLALAHCLFIANSRLNQPEINVLLTNAQLTLSSLGITSGHPLITALRNAISQPD